MRKNKITDIEKLKSKTHRIYGIYDFKKNALVNLELSLEAIELVYDMEYYDDAEEKKIISFDVILY